MEKNYNGLFERLQKHCTVTKKCNAFAYITFDELIELNDLLDRLNVYCDNVDREQIENQECGDCILELDKLVDTLITRYLNYMRV